MGHIRLLAIIRGLVPASLDAEVSRTGIRISQRHYFWYRWSNGLLVLSGADTEARDEFEDLKAWCSLGRSIVSPSSAG